MNPRVSRSSALASKATGFPIAKIAALLAVGYRLDEITNDITRETPASFEPALDYVAVKIPRWPFEKFPGADRELGPQMKSVGEVMALGRTFQEALQKALRSLEIGAFGLETAGSFPDVLSALGHPSAQRIFQIAQALRQGISAEQVCQASGYDPWFVAEIAGLLALSDLVAQHTLDSLPAELWRQAKRAGFADREISRLCGAEDRNGLAARRRRLALGVAPAYYRVDTCAAEFEAHTPYLYSTYEPGDESQPSSRRKVMILGSGPNRIGQGIEFDYCCVNACFALKELGYETIMVNCNPETVSTDYDTADRLYFEPLTLEDVLNIVDAEQPAGVIVQFGGQTPLNLALALHAAGVPIWGTSPDSIDLAEDRGRMGALLSQLGIPQPESGVARDRAEAHAVAGRIGFPLLLRPSYVLGGRGMAISYNEREMDAFLDEAMAASADRVLLLDRFVEDAFEIDVDALCDGQRVVIGGIMQHIEEAGIHSGDSACVLPPYKVSMYHLNIIRDYTQQMALALKVRGLMNAQFAIKDEIVYVLEVNPRASRTVPFVCKATGVSLARVAAGVIAGRSLAELGCVAEPAVKGFFVKESVLPFRKLEGVDARLGPEMHSTGEVMGRADTFGEAFAKAELAAGMPLPTSGSVLISVNDFDKGAILRIARDLARMGFRLLATHGTADWLRKVGLDVTPINKVSQGSPHIVDAIAGGQIDLIINTPLGHSAYSDGTHLRQAATRYGIPMCTTLSAATSAVGGIRALREKIMTVRSLQG
jgi:carbamoyl-phosphate synthase large subunit